MTKRQIAGSYADQQISDMEKDFPICLTRSELYFLIRNSYWEGMEFNENQTLDNEFNNPELLKQEEKQ